MNFFIEYHDKNVVDGHFGVLSCWFSEGEVSQDIHNIHDLVEFFKHKVSSIHGHSNIEFDIYSHLERQGHIH